LMKLGCGQHGLALSARLKMLNVPVLTIDKVSRIGDSWRNRYSRLVLHDPVWYDHMPYIPFPANWPVFTPKDKIANFFESYAELMELNVWTRTELVSNSWDDGKKEWTVTLERTAADGRKESHTVHPKHVVLATGHSGVKNFPTIPGMDDFQGDRLCHSTDFPGAKPNSHGKKAVLVGCCNSAHDLAQEFYDNGYDVTMVQRSSTFVVTTHFVVDVDMKELFSEESIYSTEDADRIFWSQPAPVFMARARQATKRQQQIDKEIHEGLTRAGFKLDMGPNQAGLFTKYMYRGGGYYIDVGASRLIAEGKIKIKQGQEPSRILPDGIEFTDGSKLNADEIVFATGFQNMRTQARVIMGDEVADRMSDAFGYDEEGELRAIYRRSGHPGCWYMGGNLAMARFFSRIVALQIKALLEGIASYDHP
jgi:cation diffusion facilitator CzcD-associated flavoprotein CzcO